MGTYRYSFWPVLLIEGWYWSSLYKVPTTGTGHPSTRYPPLVLVLVIPITCERYFITTLHSMLLVLLTNNKHLVEHEQSQHSTKFGKRSCSDLSPNICNSLPQKSDSPYWRHRLLSPQDHKSGTVCRPISDYVGCHAASSVGYWRHFYSDSEGTAQCELFLTAPNRTEIFLLNLIRVPP